MSRQTPGQTNYRQDMSATEWQKKRHERYVGEREVGVSDIIGGKTQSMTCLGQTKLFIMLDCRLACLSVCPRTYLSVC